MARKLSKGKPQIHSKKKSPKTEKGRNLETSQSLEAAKKHEREIQFIRHKGW